MSRSAPSEAHGFRFALAGIALVTVWRVALLPFDSADLFVDEAQYWFWGQELAWGYYSKPPLIGWLLRAVTEIGGDGTFWIRLPLPLIHGSTAVVVAVIGRRLFGMRAGGLAGLAFVTLPGVALGSLLVSTDTPMLLCIALAMLAHLRLAGRASGLHDTTILSAQIDPARPGPGPRQRPTLPPGGRFTPTQGRALPLPPEAGGRTRASWGWALLLGAAVGVGLLSKYAMIYFPVSAALAALVLPAARIGWRDAVIAGAVALVLVAPNLAWNVSHDFTTLQHTADNADWQGFSVDFVGLAGFWAGQFAVSGPVLFAAFVVGLGRLGARAELRYPAMMALPVLAVVSVQAAVSGANANWAAAGHLGAVLAAVAVLAGGRFWLIASFTINGAVTLGLPLAAVFADSWRIGDGNLVLRRHVGQAAISLRAAEVAGAEGLDTLVAGDRALLADFFYTLRDAGLAIYAVPAEGFPPHHYAQAHPLPAGEGMVLFVTRGDGGPDCRDGVTAEEVARWRPEVGYHTDDVTAYRVARSCWLP